MSLKLKYFLFIAIIHGILAYLLYLQFEEQKAWLLLVEVGIAISILLSIALYRQFIRPLQLLSSGADAIEDQDFQVKFLKTGSKEMDKLIGIYNQMIDRLRMERTQTEEQHYFMQQILAISPSAILLLDFDGKIDYANPKAVEQFDLIDWKGKLPADISHELFDAIAEMSPNTSKTVHPDGMSQYKIEFGQFIDKGFKRHYLIIEDISEEILKAEKRAYEKVIRMMAHEVNNSIGAINSIIQTSIDFQQEAPSFDEDIVTSLQVAKDRNDRLNKFMRNFADIIRLPLPTKELLSINTCIKNVAQLMQPLAHRQEIAFEFDLPRRAIKVEMDEKQLEQVFVNVIKNALEAIEHQGIIKITLTSKSLTIADNGRGLSDEQAAHIFTPFYSNKAHGQGIGLTLSREILFNHGFDFSLKTEGDWTRFEIVF